MILLEKKLANIADQKWANNWNEKKVDLIDILYLIRS